MGDGLTAPEVRQWLADELAGFSPRECQTVVWAGRCPGWPYRRWDHSGAVWMEPTGLNAYPADRRSGHWQPKPQDELLPPWMAADVTPWAVALAQIQARA
jgi:hypothetical protein